MVGDLQNNPGRSLFVRLTGPTSGPGARGKWTDSATSQFGDLLDIIRERTGITRFPDLLAEARVHLGRPQPVLPDGNPSRSRKSPSGTPAAASRLFAASLPLAGSLAATYLRSRGITQAVPSAALRFHPKCWHRDEGQTRPVPRPAMIAAVTDGAGVLQGVHRTWLAPDGQDKAHVEIPRRAMGHLLGNAVRLSPCDSVLVLGEGIETMLSIREAAPSLPVWAALSSSHLGAVILPAGVQRLYIARDRDPAGARATERLTARASKDGLQVMVLEPQLGDFNDDLRAHGVEALRQHLAEQIGPEDLHRLPI
ncbi:Toprim domain-containing protein [Gemmobacter aquatilis]|uniref:Toprim domain-containing protein n=2 Tax=Gemmobacter aquatilis TaxID=933059 RepID=A0A1H8LMV7_9RHOB|nr:Toprim domain-containing protein [Gemmobacter aquatilis]